MNLTMTLRDHAWCPDIPEDKFALVGCRDDGEMRAVLLTRAELADPDVVRAKADEVQSMLEVA